MTRIVALVRRGGALALGRGLGLTGVIGMDGDDPDPLDERLAKAGIRCPVAILDDIFEGAVRETDYHGLAQILAAAARTVGFDVLVCGDGSGKLGPAVAERLSLPYLGNLVRAELRDGRLVAHRLEARAIRGYASPLPVVVGAIPMPPGVAAATETQAAPGARRVLGLAEIGLSSAELRWRRRFAPRPATGGEALGRVAQFADARTLAQRLMAEGLVRQRGPAAR